MSLSFGQPMPSIAVIDPRYNLNQPKVMIIQQGGQEVSYQRISSQNVQSTTSSTFNILPPSNETLVDRRIYLRMQGTVTFNATAIAGNTILQSGRDAFRAFPFQNGVISNSTMQINDGQVNMQANEYTDVLLRLHNDLLNQQYNLSMCPSANDVSANYADLDGTNLNSLGDYKTSTPGLYQRGSFPLVNVSNPVGGSTASVTFDICEPLMLSPFIATSHKDHAALVGIKNMILTLNFASDLSRVWSHSLVNAATQPTINSISVSFTNQELLVAYLTPKPSMHITNMNAYNYTSIEYYPQPNRTLTAGSADQVSVQNLQWNTVPDTVVVWARRSDNSRKFTDPDSYIPITGVNITYFNKTGILGTATPQQLWQISKKNGLDMPWSQWTSQQQYSFGSGVGGGPIPMCGSVMVMKPALDYGLADDVANGLQTNNQFQCTVNLVNQSLNTYDYVLYVATLTEGVMTIQRGHVVTQIGTATRSDILHAKANMSPFLDFNDLQYIDASYQGGSLGSFFKDKVFPFLRNTGSKILHEVVVPAGIGYLKRRVGLGEGEGEEHDGGLGVGGGAFMGGRKMSRSALKHRLSHH